MSSERELRNRDRYIHLGIAIAALRKMRGMSQEQLAEKLYITDRAVSKWERGLSLPDASIMLELCNIVYPCTFRNQRVR